MSNTAVGDIVTITISGDTPIGVVLAPDPDGYAAVIKSWSRLPNGKFGPIQKNGGVHIGDVLFAINETKLAELPHADVTALLNNRNILQKNLKFMNGAEYMRQKRGKSGKQSNLLATPKENKAPFLSVIRRSRVNNFTSSKFVEYEIVCQLRLASTQVEKEKVFKWSVWKRYSDFEQLNTTLRRTLGWQMENIEFPSAHNFVLNKYAPDFTEQRREDLNNYWQRVISIDKVTEFNKHHCSEALKLFVDVEGALAGGGEKPSADPEPTTQANSSTEPDEQSAEKSEKKSSNSNKRLSARASSRKVNGGQRRGSVNTGESEEQEKQPSSPTPSAPQNNSPQVNTAVPIQSQSPPPSSSSSSQPAPPAPRPPPPKQSTSATSAPAPAPGPPSGGALPPRPTGARANLLGDIARLRKD
eukprot:CAMPEP_0174817962 /NCGR_PEP_ID=MMETSP1107-20130205/543_1 /TAXON_ID=36770 /ORGANISM="Paraphysomonas vestita, Strain GFlagA" /LENGTH=413 /DNA_ID=CAMNT_0016029181 /DNA_START=39 /DNA_END=1280 /DNA_ORIENTATION=+